MTGIEFQIIMERLEYNLKVAIQIIEDLVDDDPCQFDRHGYCQTHGWMDDSECPHARAKKFLKMMEEEND